MIPIILVVTFALIRGCLSCSQGYYLNVFTCTVCPAGSSCNGFLKTDCLPGTYSQAGASSCTSCPTGSFCPMPSMLPVAVASSTAIDRKAILTLAKLSTSMYDIGSSDATSTFLMAIDSTAHTLGVVTLSDDKTTIIAAFRGTNFASKDDQIVSLANVAQDLALNLVDYSLCTGCTVHYGFTVAIGTIVTKMKANLKSLQSQYPTATKLIVTGHSLGGAMATLFATDLLVNDKATGLSLITFGSPRVGNNVFSDFVNSKVPEINWRVTYDNDVVTMFPLRAGGYKHVGAEVHYVPTGNYYLLSKGVDVPYIRLSVPDHLLYSSMTL